MPPLFKALHGTAFVLLTTAAAISVLGQWVLQKGLAF